jgi:dihydropteroate synthase
MRDIRETQPAVPCSRKHYGLKIRDRVLELGPRTLIMGVLNVTPDSFSDGDRFLNPASAIERALQIAAEGADILDLGGESTRPGAQEISAEEELKRVLPVLDALAGSYPIPISIDTSKSTVALAALERGAAILNDITALKNDPEIGALAARYHAGLILMHMRGQPRNMQLLEPSPDILAETEAWSEAAVARAENLGVASDQIILDPGIGFGKTVQQNLELLRNLDRIAAKGFPILIGTSRKSFIGKILDKPAGSRIWGTAASVAAAAIFGAHIVRVHDVAEMRDVVNVVDAIIGPANKRDN